MASIEFKAAARGGSAAIARVLAGVAILALGGCSWLHFGEQDDAYDYRKAKTRQEPLEVPPDLTPLSKDERYSVPGAATAAPAKPAAAAAPEVAVAAGAVAPAGSVVAPAVAAAHIVRDGNQRWLAVDTSPEIAYATVRDVLVSQGYKIAIDEPAVGLLETEWSETRPKANEDAVRGLLQRVLGSFDSNGEQNKFRARIERTKNNTAEITISHRGLEEVFTSSMKDTTKWQARPSDPELEALLLQRIALRFAPVQPQLVAVAPAAASAAVATAAVTGPSAALGAAEPARAHKVNAGGATTLQLEDDLEHSWRRVGIALDRAGFTIEDRSREHHQYTVRYLDPDYEVREKEKRSWWDRMFNADAKVAEQEFQIVLQATSTVTAVDVRDKDGHIDNSSTAQHILDQLLEQLRG